MRPAPLPVDADEFLTRYWQREHLLIPGAIPGFAPPLDADELGGLALEDGVDARLIRRDGERWKATSAPFDLADLQQTGAWALLVHGIDRLLPDLVGLFDLVPFLPTWRRDDVLMSYATDGGGAGPHFDLYDVFILQGEGRRHWAVGQHCDPATARTEGGELRLLDAFEARASYTLECGDVLYIPPRMAHRGISEGESTSFSLGFRAPRLADLLARRVDNHLEHAADWQLFEDAGRGAAARPGEISAADAERAAAQLRAVLAADDGHWLGEVVSDGAPPAEADPSIGASENRYRAVPGRLAWRADNPGITVYAGGVRRAFSDAVIDDLQALCGGDAVAWDAARPERCELLQWLAAQGTVFDDEP